MGEGHPVSRLQNSEITLRQIRNSGAGHLAPFGLRTDVFRFDGSFLSLVLDLPDAAVTGLRLNHLIRLDMVVELEKPIRRSSVVSTSSMVPTPSRSCANCRIRKAPAMSSSTWPIVA
ncbi:MAG: DUF6478 family protein [Paracoccaceae bacterium]